MNATVEPHQFALFDTAVGRCAIVWTGVGIAGVQLPERSEQSTRTSVLRRYRGAVECAPGTEPAPARRAMDGIVALLSGEKRDLAGIKLDDRRLTGFNRKVYAQARMIAPGKTTTYGDIAKALGDASAAQMVGQAMGENPFPLIVPCHRVLAAGGKIGGFSAPGGTVTKTRLLAIEGAPGFVEQFKLSLSE